VGANWLGLEMLKVIPCESIKSINVMAPQSKPLRFPYGTGPGTPMGPHNGPRNKPVVLVVRVAACASSAPTGADGRRKTWW
jgi:hypothetical protein